LESSRQAAMPAAKRVLHEDETIWISYTIIVLFASVKEKSEETIFCLSDHLNVSHI